MLFAKFKDVRFVLFEIVKFSKLVFLVKSKDDKSFEVTVNVSKLVTFVMSRLVTS